MRSKLLTIPVTALAIGAGIAMASPAQAQTVTSKTVSLKNSVVAVALHQSTAGTVTVSESCTPADGETFTIGLTSSGGVVPGPPKQFSCDGVSHPASWANVPAGTDTLRLTKTKPTSTTLRVALRIGLPGVS